MEYRAGLILGRRAGGKGGGGGGVSGGGGGGVLPLACFQKIVGGYGIRSGVLRIDQAGYKQLIETGLADTDTRWCSALIISFQNRGRRRKKLRRSGGLKREGTCLCRTAS